MPSTRRNDWFHDESFVKIVLRNQAAERGANLVTLDVIKSSGNLISGSGRASPPSTYKGSVSKSASTGSTNRCTVQVGAGAVSTLDGVIHCP